MKISLVDGKYTAIFEEDTGRLYALRYDQEWRDLSGDNFVLGLMQEIKESAEIASECLEIISRIWDQQGKFRKPADFLLLINALEEKLVEIRRGVNEDS